MKQNNKLKIFSQDRIKIKKNLTKKAYSQCFDHKYPSSSGENEEIVISEIKIFYSL